MALILCKSQRGDFNSLAIFVKQKNLKEISTVEENE